MNIEGYKIISDNIAWDPIHQYSCRRCGKADYKNVAAVKGHMGNSCPGKAIQKGIQPTTASYSLAGAARKASLQGYPTGLSATAIVPEYSQPDSQKYGEIYSRLSKLENEYNHMLVDKNQSNTVSSIGAWFEANKGMILLIGGSFLLVSLLRESSCHCDCDTPRNYTRSKRNGRGGLGSDMLNSAASQLVKKGIDEVTKRVFK